MRDADFVRIQIDTTRKAPWLTMKAARSAALQKAMSAALLNHQINELEAQVQDLGVTGGDAAAQPQSQQQPRGLSSLNPSARIWGDDDVDPRHLSAREPDAGDFGVIGGGRKTAGTSPQPAIARRELDEASIDRVHEEPQGQHHGAKHRRALENGPAGPQVRKLANLGRIDDTPQDSDSVDGGHNTRSESSDDEGDEDMWDTWKIVVLDVSALMWAPQSVRRLLARGWEAVLPLEGE